MNKKIEFLLELLNDELRAIHSSDAVESFVILRTNTEYKHRSANGEVFPDDAFFQDSDLYKNVTGDHWELP